MTARFSEIQHSKNSRDWADISVVMDVVPVEVLDKVAVFVKARISATPCKLNTAAPGRHGLCEGELPLRFPRLEDNPAQSSRFAKVRAL